MTPSQCRMGRAALQWSAADLARESGLGYATVARFESDQTINDRSRQQMREAIERAGIEFIPAGAAIRSGKGPAGPGIRVKSNDAGLE